MFIKRYKFILVNKYVRISIDNKFKMYDASLIHKFKTHYMIKNEYDYNGTTVYIFSTV